MAKTEKIPAAPQLLSRKIYKTGQTRGADDDVIYQNRVARSSTVLIPYELWDDVSSPPEGEAKFESGYIALIKPETYFGTEDIEDEIKDKGLVLGKNALVFYQMRSDWYENDPTELGWSPASSRTDPLGGKYVARIAATTAIEDGGRINHGFTDTKTKGAGIRLFEYASTATIKKTRLQLELLYWCCENSVEIVTQYGMSADDAKKRYDHIRAACDKVGLADFDHLRAERMVDDAKKTICPLCLERLDAGGFFHRLAQAEGREVHDLTVTELNLFHIKEVRYGEYNHKQYNLGWGHHHCNVVVKDSGIEKTLEWMIGLIDRNREAGLL
jgi:hypothetical protein